MLYTVNNGKEERLLALTIIHGAMEDFRNEDEPASYFTSRDFEFWCEIAKIDPAKIREILNIIVKEKKRVHPDGLLLAVRSSLMQKQIKLLRREHSEWRS